jgi:tetratricopeptide (TPR) repeat protein
MKIISKVSSILVMIILIYGCNESPRSNNEPDEKYNNNKKAMEYRESGIAKVETGDNKGAIEDYNKSIELNATDPSVWNNRGVAKSNLGDNKGAIEDYNKSISLDSNVAEVYLNRGNSKVIEDPKGAVVEYDKALELNPNYADAYLSRGLAKIILLEKRSEGCMDLYKAVDLGLVDANDEIKAYCN